jgi:hypothetical protein
MLTKRHCYMMHRRPTARAQTHAGRKRAYVEIMGAITYFARKKKKHIFSLSFSCRVLVHFTFDGESDMHQQPATHASQPRKKLT